MSQTSENFLPAATGQTLGNSGQQWDGHYQDVTVYRNLYAKSANKVRMADQFTGTDAGDRISAAITDLPSGGGTIDASGLEGAQTISSDIFSGVTKSVLLILPAGTITVSESVTVPSNVTLVFTEGTILSVSVTKTLTINGCINAPLSQIFAGSGTVTISMSKVEGLWVQWFAGSDVGAKANAAIAALPATGGTIYHCGGTSIATTIAMDRSIVFRGRGDGDADTTAPCVLSYNSGVTGITLSSLAKNCVLEDFYMKSASAGSGTDDGIRIQGRAVSIRGVTVDGFGRYGFNFAAGGNNNVWTAVRARAINCKSHGWYLTGTDTNVGFAQGCEARANAGYGLYIDSAVYGCTFVSFHIDATLTGAIYVAGAGNNFQYPWVESGAVDFAAGSRSNYWIHGTGPAPTITDSGTAGTNLIINNHSGAVTSAFRFQGSVYNAGVITPTTLTGDVDNYNPAGLALANVIRLDGGAAARNITGIMITAGLQGGNTGRTLKIFNISTTAGRDLVLKHNTTSTAANRIYGPNLADHTIRPGGAAELVYDETTAVWRVVYA